MDIIAGVFGPEWLGRRPASPKSRRAGDHPVRNAWLEVDDLLRASARLPPDLSRFASVGLVLDLGTTLSWTCMLPGFDRQMRGRLQLPEEYDGALFEIKVARRHAQDGQDVRFIDTPGHAGKGPDLRIMAASRPVLVEAKYKDRIEVFGSNAPFESLLRELVGAALEDCPIGVDITGVVMGMPGEAVFRAAVAAAVERVKEGFRGTQFFPDPGFWLAVEDRVSPAGPVTPESLAALGTRGARLRLGPAPDGSVVEKEGSTFRLAAMPGHTVDSVLENVKKASKQIGSGAVGVVYVGVDHGDHDFDTVTCYLTLMGKAVAGRIWRGDQNKRIRAIVLTAGPIPKVSEKDGYRFIASGYAHSTFYQPGIVGGSDESAASLLESVLSLPSP